MSFNNEFKYEQSTLSKFDIIGSYFVNLFYNEFYSKANTLKLNGTYNNTTEAYKSILGSYLDFIKKPEYFKQIIKGIHAYCISTTRYTTMSHKDCIDFMVNEFIPQKLWNSIRENQKNKLFHESINHSINIFTTEIISNHLVMIIDNHSHQENITILQDLFLKIILLEKDKIYSKFLNPESNNTISIELFKTKVMELINDKKDLSVLNNKLTKNIDMLNKLTEKNNSIIVELQSKNKSYINTINELKNNINYLTKKNIELTVQINKRTQEVLQNGSANKNLKQVQALHTTLQSNTENIKFNKDSTKDNKDITKDSTKTLDLQTDTTQNKKKIDNSIKKKADKVKFSIN